MHQPILRTCTISKGQITHLARVDRVMHAAELTLCGDPIFNMPPLHTGKRGVCKRCTKALLTLPDYEDVE